MKIDRIISGLAFAAALAAPLPAFAAKVVLTTMLDGNSEPIAGDPDGIGKFSVELDVDTGEVCYLYVIAKIARPNQLQILRGPIGSNGPPVLFLEPGSDVCVGADPQVVNAIIANPGDYYVNFYNKEFPTGAVRGQLAANQLAAK